MSFGIKLYYMARITDPEDVIPANTVLPNNGKTILIAEDDPFISRMYQTKLTNSGFEVVIKTNGRDALQTITEIHPDLMMLDISMPEISGLDVLSSLVQNGYDFKTSPALILTNSSDPKMRKKAESLGAEYIVKAEVTPRNVLDRIKAKLGINDAPNAGPTV